MKDFRHILVGIDFSPASQVALREAARWAALDGARVTAMHVMEEDAAAQMRKALGLDATQLHQQVEQRLKAFLVEAGLGAAPVQAVIKVGHPFEDLLEACQKLGVDLLVLGSRGATHSVNQVGAIAGKCLRKAPVDVLLVKETAVGPFKQVLACVDFSETSGKAVERAAHLAQKDRAALDCIFFFQSAPALAADYGGLIPPAMPVLDQESVSIWRKDLEEFADPFLPAGKSVHPHCVVIEDLNIREAILRHIEDTHAGLVVLGTRGKTDLRTLLLGTTAERIVEHAPCSILAVKPADFNRAAQ